MLITSIVQSFLLEFLKFFLWKLYFSNCLLVIILLISSYGHGNSSVQFFQQYIFVGCRCLNLKYVGQIVNKFTWIYVGEIRPSTCKTFMILNSNVSLFHTERMSTNSNSLMRYRMQDIRMAIHNLTWRQKRFIAIVWGQPKSNSVN